MPLVKSKSKALNAIGGGQNGITTPQNHLSSAPAALVSNRAVAGRFSPVRGLTVKTISFRVTTASGTNDPVDVGIYDAAGNKLSTSGAVLGKLNVLGTQNVDIPDVTLKAGVDYYAAISGTSTATLASATVITDIYGTTVGLLEAFTKATAHPLPTSIAASATAADAAPFLFLVE